MKDPRKPPRVGKVRGMETYEKYRPPGNTVVVQAGLAKTRTFLASICHAITEPPVTKIRLWASFGV